MPIPATIAEQRDLEKLRALRHLRSLPSLGLEDTKNGDVCCPICLISFENIHEDEMLACQREDSRHSSSSIQPEGSNTMHGVVKLSVCGHVFCRRDLAEWIESFHGSCPTCRQVFFEFTPVNEAEYESSDGGEYLPDEDELEEDEFFTDDDLIPSSDFLTDIEMEDIDEDDEVEVSFSLDDEPQSEVSGTQAWDGSSVYADVSDDELEDDDVDDMPELEVPSDGGVPELDSGASSENDSTSTFGGVITDGSTSDGPSFRIRQDEFSEPDAYSTGLKMVTGTTTKADDNEQVLPTTSGGNTPV